MTVIDDEGRPEPPLAGDEVETLTGFLDYQRATLDYGLSSGRQALAWFTERDWRMRFQVQDVMQYGDVGIARVKYDSQVRDKAGRYRSKREALLSLTFRREDGAWRLVYDQNTVVPPTEKK